MVVETEIKLSLKSPEIKKAIKEYLEKNCKYEDTYNQIDVYLVHPCKDFLTSDEAFRIRLENNKCFLTYKGPREKGLTKKRIEIEVEVKNCEKTMELLGKLGFNEFIKVKKTRKKYDCNNLMLLFDEVNGLGNYVEIEAKNKIGEKELNRLIRELKLENDIVKETYLELLLKKTNTR